MDDAGAQWLDVGAVSSRPGPVVSEEEEWQRLAPVLPIALATGAHVSVDTRRGGIARSALAAGVSLVNDIAGGSDPELLQATAAHDAAICLMHMHGELARCGVPIPTMMSWAASVPIWPNVATKLGKRGLRRIRFTLIRHWLWQSHRA